jgi:hypothetical protein
VDRCHRASGHGAAFGQPQPSRFRWENDRQLAGVALHLIRADDIVVAKLDGAKLGGSDRQIRDVVGVLMVQGPDLDRSYVEG